MSKFKPTNRERFYLEDLNTLYERYGEFYRWKDEGVWYWSEEELNYAKSFLKFNFYLVNDTPYSTVKVLAPRKGLHVYVKDYTVKHPNYVYKKVPPYSRVNGKYIICDGTLSNFIDKLKADQPRWETYAKNVKRNIDKFTFEDSFDYEAYEEIQKSLKKINENHSLAKRFLYKLGF